MDDLSSLDWDAPSSEIVNTISSGVGQHYLTLQHSPSLSRQPSPLSAQRSGDRINATLSSRPVLNPSGHDSFSKLLASNSAKTINSLSLQERQKQLLEEKARQAIEQKKRHDNQFHSDDSSFWEGLGSGRCTPAPGYFPSADQINYNSSSDKDDLLSSFHASAPIDSSSYFTPSARKRNPVNEDLAPNAVHESSEDDDPFGLGHLHQGQPATASHSGNANEDDVLGELGKPVPNQPSVGAPLQHSSKAGGRNGKPAYSENIADVSIAQLVDMGFSVDRSREALANTDTGTNIQAAIGWLVNQAHQESENNTSTQNWPDQAPSDRRCRNSQQNGGTGDHSEVVPAWLRGEDGVQRGDSGSSTSGEKYVVQYAAELGSSFLKSASSLWKTGQKKVQSVAIEFEQDGDGSQPRWMRGASSQNDQDEQIPCRQQNARPPQQHGGNVTDEAMMLESGRSAPGRPPKHRYNTDTRPALSSGSSSRRRSPKAADETSGRSPSSSCRPSVQSVVRPVERLSRQAVEEQSFQAYISPARRKKLPHQPEPSLEIFSALQPQTSSARTVPQATPARAAVPPAKALLPPVRPNAPPRHIPPISSTALSTSITYRQQGTEAYRRGDYAEAQDCYTRALSPLPDAHPSTIILRCSRALANIKIGEPKAAIADADAALGTIGPFRGEGEIVAMGGTEADKPMQEFYGKALICKAEALEHMEKWTFAASVWREAVEANIGGATAIQGRNRCEKASNAASRVPHTSMSDQATRPAQSRKSPSRSVLSNPNDARAESDAVKRLRAANAAAATASDEAFALTDLVDGRLTAWKTGKSENLRALLASLDTVLWPLAGWSKVGMGDLVMPSKVKVVYMKAIAKVHPDKISQTATTEQRMISGSVFATLNEAWDRFKMDNGL